MATPELLPQVVRDNYEVVEKAHYWELWCLKCSRGWRLDKASSGKVPLRTLHLVNHAKSHAA